MTITLRPECDIRARRTSGFNRDVFQPFCNANRRLGHFSEKLERILRLQASVDELKEISGKVLQTAPRVHSCSERLGHQKFVLTVESFELSATAERRLVTVLQIMYNV